VLAVLRELILSGAVTPGVHLREVEIANGLGVSRGPVREAIRQLEQEGLVDFYPRRGAVVAGVPETEVELIYRLRASIEGEAFAAACRQATNGQLDDLTDLWYSMHRAMRDGNLDGVLDADLAFHHSVVEIGASPFVRRMAASLDGVVRATVLRAYREDDSGRRAIVERDVESHLPLLDALRQRDVERARGLAIEHIDLPDGLNQHVHWEATGRSIRATPVSAGSNGDGHGRSSR
jgi:DNA-binding GntR family transcriptional regulator